MTDEITVICPKHGEHEHAITSNIPGHEGAWCQLCWLESLGSSLPYKAFHIAPDDRRDIMDKVDEQFDAEFGRLPKMAPIPNE